MEARGARLMQPFGPSIFSNRTWCLITRSLGLSQRESEIIQGLFGDQKESGIAYRLGISPHTVHTHVERLYRKVGVTSRVALARRVFGEYMYVAKAVGAFTIKQVTGEHVRGDARGPGAGAGNPSEARRARSLSHSGLAEPNRGTRL
jgi:DNA-binding CsgD family transcriptional regulator